MGREYYGSGVHDGQNLPQNLTPEEIRENIFIYVLRILADVSSMSVYANIRNHFGAPPGFRIDFLNFAWHDPRRTYEEAKLKQILMPILREYIPNNMVVNIKDRHIGIKIMRNEQGNWLPKSVSLAMNKEIQQATKQFLIKLFQKVHPGGEEKKSQDGEWSMRRESAIRTLQNSKPIIELRKRVNAPGGPGQEVARLSYAAAEEEAAKIAAQEEAAKIAAQEAAQENPSSSSQGETKVSTSRCVGDNDCWRGEESKEMCLSYNMDPETKKSRCSWKGGRRRKKTRRKKKRKTKSHRRRKSKKRKTKSRKIK